MVKRRSTSDPRPWALYMVRTQAGSLYVGISTDVSRRFREHSGGKRGAKYLKNKGELTLAYHSDAFMRCGEALRVEKYVKSMAKARKERCLADLIAGTATARGLLERCAGRPVKYGWLTKKIAKSAAKKCEAVAKTSEDA